MKYRRFVDSRHDRLGRPEELVNSYTSSKNPAQTADEVHWAGDGSGESWVIKAEFTQYGIVGRTDQIFDE